METINYKGLIPHGTSDVLNRDMRIQQHIIGIIQNVYERFGFSPHDTPIIENDAVFDGHHGEGEKLLFHLRCKDGNPLVLRYDLTVPLARVINMHGNSLHRPYRRYQIGPVFRDEVVDGHHFRQFIQCDGDVIGCDDLLVDAEIIMLAYSGLRDLGFSDFTIRINHREIFQEIVALHKLTDKQKVVDIQRALDKFDKHARNGINDLRFSLKQYGVEEDVVDTIMEILNLSGSPFEILANLKKIVGDQKGVNELEKIISYLPLKVIDVIKIDPSLARGADYYTGFILEGIINGASVGAVLGGGRYNNLVAAFGGQPEPAVGMAFGFERILKVMEQLKMLGSLQGCAPLLKCSIIKL